MSKRIVEMWQQCSVDEEVWQLGGNFVLKIDTTRVWKDRLH